MVINEGSPAARLDALGAAREIFAALSPLGVRAVYGKIFAQDRSRLGGALPADATDPTPLAGEPLPEFILVRENGMTLEVRLFDGLSTGLFLDHREHRACIRNWCAQFVARTGRAPQVLNTFAYTGAFSVAAALGGGETTSVDVSPRYLDWARRNFQHNALECARHAFVRADVFEHFRFAQRHDRRYDLIILDPPSFSAGSKKKDVAPWSAVRDYPRLLRAAGDALAPGGVIFAATNNHELCRPRRFDEMIRQTLGTPLAFEPLPPPPLDFAMEQGKLAARAWRGAT